MLYIHRWASLLAGVVILYIACTGLFVQSMDLFARSTGQPVTNPAYQEFHQHLAGTDNYAVLSDLDYTAQALPAGLDYQASIARAAANGRLAAPGAPLRLVEIRMMGDRLMGHVQMAKQHMLFDLASGQRQAKLPKVLINANEITPGWRSTVKSWHKFAFNKFLLQKASTLNILAAFAVFTLMVTGLAHYWKLLKVRRKIGKPELFWKAGGVWRRLHRWAAVVFSIVILYLAFTGLLLAISDVGAGYAEWKSPRDQRPMNPDKSDYSSPLADAQLPGMVAATLAAYGKDHADLPVKVMRIRTFSGYPQGVIVSGGSGDPHQHVYDTRDGRELSDTEPGYPVSNFPFGWQWHQTVKTLHRGDFFGLAGSWIEWLGGVALLYFAVSGLWMYIEMWRHRARSGRRAIVWKK